MCESALGKRALCVQLLGEKVVGVQVLVDSRDCRKSPPTGSDSFPRVNVGRQCVMPCYVSAHTSKSTMLHVTCGSRTPCKVWSGYLRGRLLHPSQRQMRSGTSTWRTLQQGLAWRPDRRLISASGILCGVSGRCSKLPCPKTSIPCLGQKHLSPGSGMYAFLSNPQRRSGDLLESGFECHDGSGSLS